MTLLIFLALTTLAPAEPQTQWERTHKGAVQSTPLPKAGSDGEYSRAEAAVHPFWQVVAPDGLNGRSGSFGRPGANPATWPVVRVFPCGTLLTAYPGPHTQTGWPYALDKDDHYWLMVVSGDPNEPLTTCWVRLNSKYVKPVKVQDQ